MKYVLPLLLVTSAALALAPQTPFDLAGLWPDPVPPSVPLHVDPPWLSAGWEDSSQGADADPHAGLYGESDPHLGLYGEAADPHAGLHAPELPLGVPVISQSVPRSTLANGHTVAEIFAQRMSLRERPVAVRGTVVKRTDGILGKTYLHLRDGSGSPERRDHDLTVTADGEFQIGEVVEVEGQLLVDQDLGLGYRYAALLEAAHRARPK